jgi:hypothetical protein
MEKYKKNAVYLEKNFKEIEKCYDDKFITFDDINIIGSNRRLEKLIKELEQNSKNIPSIIIKPISENNYLD